MLFLLLFSLLFYTLHPLELRSVHAGRYASFLLLLFIYLGFYFILFFILFVGFFYFLFFLSCFFFFSGGSILSRSSTQSQNLNSRLSSMKQKPMRP